MYWSGGLETAAFPAHGTFESARIVGLGSGGLLTGDLALECKAEGEVKCNMETASPLTQVTARLPIHSRIGT